MEEKHFGIKILNIMLCRQEKGTSAFVYLPVPAELIWNAITSGCLTWVNTAAACGLMTLPLQASLYTFDELQIKTTNVGEHSEL